jgi:hypothetical protein
MNFGKNDGSPPTYLGINIVFHYTSSSEKKIERSGHGKIMAKNKEP